VVAVGQRGRHSRFHGGRERPSPTSPSPPPNAAWFTSSGTTGLSAFRRCRDQERHYTRLVVVKSGNMSLGVNLLAGAGEAGRPVRWTTASTSKSWRCITRPRSTRPRGTALLLGEAAAEGRGKIAPAGAFGAGAATAIPAARQNRRTIGFRIAARRHRPPAITA